MTLCRTKASRRANLALVPLTALLLSSVGHAAPSTAITTCPFFITTPGQYHLAMDLTCPPGDGVHINNASGVNLYLDGHTLQGVLVGAGIIALNSTAILIQGPGTITGFGDGLEFINVGFSKVIQVTATRNSTNGFVVIGPPSTNNVFQGNVATLNVRQGISLIDTATSNTLRGISLTGTQNEIGGNTAVGNAREDMFDSAPNCDDNRWLGNRFVTANQSCIQ